MDTASISFGRRLKSQRERRGILLETIAASTKIKGSLLADLERDDLSKWPRGIFRRAFVREYAAAIGLEPEPVVAEFVRLFPDEEFGDAPPAQPVELRLTLADNGRAPVTRTPLRVAAVMLETCAVLALAAAVTWMTGSNFWAVCAAASLIYYPLGSAFWGRSPALRWLDTWQNSASGGQRVGSNTRDLLDLLVQQTQMRGSDEYRTAMSSHAAAADNLDRAPGLILPS